MDFYTMYTGEVRVGQWIHYKPCWTFQDITVPFKVTKIYPHFVVAESDSGVRECFPLVNRADVVGEEFDKRPERPNQRVRQLIERTGLSMCELSRRMYKNDNHLSNMLSDELTEVRQNMLLREIIKATGVT